MSSLNFGGRGKTAPYESQHYRIPVPIKDAVRMFADRYRQLVSGGVSDPTGVKLIRRVEDAIVADDNHGTTNNLMDILGTMNSDSVNPGTMNGEKDDNDWYCRYQELLSQSDLWREKADERDRDFPLLEQRIKSLEGANEDLVSENQRLVKELEQARSQLEDVEVSVGEILRLNLKSATGYEKKSFARGVRELILLYERLFPGSGFIKIH